VLQVLATWTSAFQDPAWIAGVSGLVTAIGGIVWGNRRHGRHIADVVRQIEPTFTVDQPSLEDHYTLREMVASISTSLDLFREENRHDHEFVRKTISDNHREHQAAMAAVAKDVISIRERLARAETEIEHTKDEIHLTKEIVDHNTLDLTLLRDSSSEGT
jgi:hypothetical protein